MDTRDVLKEHGNVRERREAEEPRRKRRQFTPEFKSGAVKLVLGTAEGWLYLAVLMDLFSRKVVGWAMGERLDRELVLSALDMALLGRPSPALHHSDRGSQYASEDYRRLLEQRGITCSMSLSPFAVTQHSTQWPSQTMSSRVARPYR